VELVEEKRFPGSTPAREKPFRMYKDTKKITVRLTDLEEGWIFDKTSDPQVKCNFYSKTDLLRPTGDRYSYFNFEDFLTSNRAVNLYKTSPSRPRSEREIKPKS